MSDLIERQAAIDGLEKYHEGADLHIDGLTYAYDLICKLPSVSTEKTATCTEDIPCIKCSQYDKEKHYCPHFCRVIRDVFEEKTGRWIEQEGYDGDTYYDCSVCGESFCLIDGTPTDNLYNYCPNCGAKMGGVEE